MTDFKFIHAADIHLDSPLKGIERYEGAPVDRIRNATRSALTNLVNFAIEEKVRFVLIAGDLYDGDWKDLNTGAFFVREMQRLREVGIRVFLIAGNHDARNEMTRELTLPDNVKFFLSSQPESEVIEDLGVVIHGQSFAGRKITEDLSANYPQALAGLFNIGLLHTSAMGYPEHDTYAPCSLDGLLSKGYQYWALGHIHKRTVLCNDPPILFPGNIQGRHIREEGIKGCTLVSVENGAVTHLEECPLAVLRWIHAQIDAIGAEEPEEVVDRLPAALKDHLINNEEVLLAVRLHVVGDTNADAGLRANLERWIAELRLKAGEIDRERIWIEKVLIETCPIHNHAKDPDANSFLAVLAEYLDESERAGVLAPNLLSAAEDLQRELQQDVREIEMDFYPDTPDRVGETLRDVRQTLFSRLIGKEEIR